MKRFFVFALLFCMTTRLIAQIATPTTLHIGTTQGDITPPKNVPLMGQFNLRLSQGVETSLTVNVVALESTCDGKQLDAAIFVSLDLASVEVEIYDRLNKK